MLLCMTNSAVRTCSKCSACEGSAATVHVTPTSFTSRTHVGYYSILALLCDKAFTNHLQVVTLASVALEAIQLQRQQRNCLG